MMQRRVWSLMILLLAACHGESSSNVPVSAPAPAKNPVPVKRGPTPQELTSGMVEAVALGKTSVPLTVKFDLPQRPLVGQPLEILIALLPEIAGSATLQVSGSEGLRLAAGTGKIEIPAVDPTQAYRISIAATPTADGVQLLGVQVTLTHDDATDSRAFSVPVIVSSDAGEVAAAKH